MFGDKVEVDFGPEIMKALAEGRKRAGLPALEENASRLRDH
jgi:hypothetical protein